MNEVPAFKIGDEHTLLINFEDQEIAIIETNEDESEDVVIMSLSVLQGVLTVLQNYINSDGKLIRSEGLYVQ